MTSTDVNGCLRDKDITAKTLPRLSVHAVIALNELEIFDNDAWQISGRVGSSAASMRSRLAKEAERGGGGREPPDGSGGDVEDYLPSFKKVFALSLIAFVAILGPFQPMISSFLSSNSSVAIKNFSSSC